MDATFEIFLVATPGLEQPLADEARAAGFAGAQVVPGGVTFTGGWPDVWRANLCLRGASRILARFASFRAMHLAQLDKRARRIDWAAILRPGVPVKVDATCHASRIYHAGAAAERIAGAIAAALGPAPDGEGIIVKARIDDDLVTLSVDTSGEGLHKRGHKQAVNRAPLRETMAAMFLSRAGFDGREPVIDPMCGSGTFVIEAAEIAAGLPPGRSRAFAFETLAGFDPAACAAMKAALMPPPPAGPVRYLGFDRDAGAVAMATDNAARAGVTALTRFGQAAISELTPPDGPPGLVIANPPYGGRIGDRGALMPLYAAFGRVLRDRFTGWRVGIVTNDAALAGVMALPFLPPDPPVLHGGIRVTLYRTAPLP